MSPAVNPLTQPVILGFDPGHQKCGVAVMGLNRQIYHHAVIASAEAVQHMLVLQQRYPVTLVVMGDQTTARQWQEKLTPQLDTLRIVLVDERYSTLEARDRYWQMYPPQSWRRLLPKGLRTPPRPIDDIVAILLIERYLNRLIDAD